jgi:2-methylcitrate dehydratase PrpD
MKQGGATVTLTKGVASPVAQPLAELAASLAWEGLSEAVRHEARRSFVNIVATMIAGSRDHSVHKLLSALKPLMGPPRATVVGCAGLVDTISATFLNAVSGKVLDLADAHPATPIHPGATILASLLGLAESRRLSGSELLTAFVAGGEVAFRLGRALAAEQCDGKCYMIAPYSVVGAAAAVGKLLGLSESKIRNAMCIAVTQASGLIDNLSDVAKCIGAGEAARSGFLAAHYAQADVVVSGTAPQGPVCFLDAFLNPANSTAAIANLGSSWEFLENRSKPYACCAFLYPLVDAVRDLREREKLSVDRINEVVVLSHPSNVRRGDRPRVSTGREAKFSIQFTTAIALIRGTANLPDFLDSVLSDRRVLELSRLVKVEENASIGPEWGFVRVKTSDGQTFECLVKQCRDSQSRQLEDWEITEKTVGLIEWAAPQLRAPHLVEALWNVNTAKDVQPLIARTVPSKSPTMVPMT